MDSDHDDVRQAIKDAHLLQQLEGKDYVINAYASWGTPQQVHILAYPARLSPTLEPAVLLERATGTVRAKIRALGYSEAEAAQAKLFLEPVEAEKSAKRE
jgi:hypothetical protein